LSRCRRRDASRLGGVVEAGGQVRWPCNPGGHTIEAVADHVDIDDHDRLAGWSVAQTRDLAFDDDVAGAFTDRRRPAVTEIDALPSIRWSEELDGDTVGPTTEMQPE